MYSLIIANGLKKCKNFAIIEVTNLLVIIKKETYEFKRGRASCAAFTV